MGSTQLYPELYLAIFDRLDRAPGFKADLRNVSETCCLFHALAESLLFTEIHLQMDYSESGIETRTRALIHHLTSRAETRHWVKSIKISAYPYGEMAINRIADIFVELHNLRDVVFKNFDLTDSMVRHLLRLSHPFSLDCWAVGCTAEAENFVRDPQKLQIVELRIDQVREPNMIPFVARLALGPHLLALDLREYDSSHIYPNFLQNSGHSFDSLRNLEVYQPEKQVEMTGFLNFLASCPQLSRLKINPIMVRWGISEAKPAFLLPPTSIPHLSSFEAAYDLAGLLVQGRPVLSLMLRCHRWNNLDRVFLSRLAEGSTPLKGLDIDCVIWRNDILLNIAEYFPALQKFNLRVLANDYCNPMLERLTSDVKWLPLMQRFVIRHFTSGPPEDDIPQDTLKLLEVTNDCVALCGFQLKTERYKDERRWILLPLSQV
ncbi:hypothetical protein FRB94_011076 [Tulasnella sp. JGI-2019a]|nr:hypothetical protein FRB94_011076 [Tulasnella sp. JGI-2019a]